MCAAPEPRAQESITKSQDMDADGCRLTRRRLPQFVLPPESKKGPLPPFSHGIFLGSFHFTSLHFTSLHFTSHFTSLLVVWVWWRRCKAGLVAPFTGR